MNARLPQVRGRTSTTDLWSAAEFFPFIELTTPCISPASSRIAKDLQLCAGHFHDDKLHFEAPNTFRGNSQISEEDILSHRRDV